MARTKQTARRITGSYSEYLIARANLQRLQNRLTAAEMDASNFIPIDGNNVNPIRGVGVIRGGRAGGRRGGRGGRGGSVINDLPQIDIAMGNDNNAHLRGGRIGQGNRGYRGRRGGRGGVCRVRARAETSNAEYWVASYRGTRTNHTTEAAVIIL